MWLPLLVAILFLAGAVANLLDAAADPAEILAGLVAVGFAIRWSLPNWTGSMRLAFERIPPWSTYKTMQGAVFFSNLAILLNAGADLLQTMVHIHKHASPWLQQRLQDTMYGLSMGKNLGVALDLAGH